MAYPSGITFHEDVIGRAFVCTTPVRNHKGEMILNVHEGGEVVGVQAMGQVVKVRVLSRTEKTTVQVGMSNIRIGEKITNTELPIYLQGHQHITSLHKPPPGRSDFGGRSDIRTHLSGLLTGIVELKTRIPHLYDRHEFWLRNDDSIKDACKIIRDNMKRCSPGLPGVLVHVFTLDEIIGACRVVTSTNHSAGIYLRIYSDFRPDSEYAGHLPYIYVGQTNDMSARSVAHHSDMWNDKMSNYHSFHYTVARAATKCRVIQLSEHHENEGGNQEHGRGLRDITEQLFVMLLSSYSSKALNWRENVATKPVAQQVAEDFSWRELAVVYSDLAAVALMKTGFELPGKQGRAKAFGVQGGCNSSSPLGGEVVSGYVKTTWSVTSLHDRWIFQRPSFKLAADGALFTLKRRDDAMTIFTSRDPATGLDHPRKGDTVYTSWELMKPGFGEHPTPYSVNPAIGPYDMWSYANKSSFKAIWKSEQDGKWRVRFYQKPKILLPDGNEEGCLDTFARGIALYAHFVRSHWPSKPAFVPSYGHANLMQVNVDVFRRRIDVSIVTGSLTMLSGPIFNREVVRKDLRDAGFENVDGPWMSLDYSYLKDPTHFPGGVMPSGRSLAAMKQRKLCDYCAVYYVLKSEVKCERHENTNRCKNCIRRGLSCSWTALPKLFGSKWSSRGKEERGWKKTQDQPFKRIRELLVRKDAVDESRAVQVISDPGYRPFTGI